MSDKTTTTGVIVVAGNALIVWPLALSLVRPVPVVVVVVIVFVEVVDVVVVVVILFDLFSRHLTLSLPHHKVISYLPPEGLVLMAPRTVIALEIVRAQPVVCCWCHLLIVNISGQKHNFIWSGK